MINKVSPVNQDFIWLAEYANGTYLSEFDFVTKEENSFYNIKKNELIRFGLVGHGFHLYYEIFSGIFKLNGQMIEVIYSVDDKDYYLTGQPLIYKDIISYKDAESVFNPFNNKNAFTQITQYNFGYKQKLNIDNVNFNFKSLCKIPLNQPICMNFWLVSDQDLNGILKIKKNGKIVDQFEAPLKKNVGGELNWILKY